MNRLGPLQRRILLLMLNSDKPMSVFQIATATGRQNRIIEESIERLEWHGFIEPVDTTKP